MFHQPISVARKIFDGSLQALLMGGLAVGFGLLAPATAQPPPALPCKAGTFVKDELYFGMAKPTGGEVSVVEWQHFLNRTVTPRFKEGLTIITTYGQYQSKTGKLVVEPSRVVVVVYESGENREQAIEEIISTYKKNFEQESVMRLTHCIQVRF